MISNLIASLFSLECCDVASHMSLLLHTWLNIINNLLHKHKYSSAISLIFFVSLLFADENNSLSQTIPDKPIKLHHFVKLCEQRRKFRVLYKLEFQVSDMHSDVYICEHVLAHTFIHRRTFKWKRMSLDLIWMLFPESARVCVTKLCLPRQEKFVSVN